jgi:hypothetical protein
MAVHSKSFDEPDVVGTESCQVHHGSEFEPGAAETYAKR